MTRPTSSAGSSPARRQSLTPARLLLLVILLVAAWLIQKYGEPPREDVRDPPAVAVRETEERISTLPAEPEATPSTPTKPPAAKPKPATKTTPTQADSQIENVTIRDLDGKVVFRGTIDVQPTLDRIAAGKLLDYRNDGSTFANREGRLPKKRSGYYKEYVHPTRGQSGPGPQRIVTGAEGEIYYTHDHYLTFKKLR